MAHIIEKLDQDKINPVVIQIITNFNEELRKYKSKDKSSAIIQWLNNKGVAQPETLNMKNNDVVISKKATGEQHINGPSIVYYKDKTIFIGSLVNSQRSGFGFRTFIGSPLIYAGEYKNDNKDGIGRLYSLKSNRWVFKGLYGKDLRNGHGQLEKDDGSVYYGNYTNDRMHNSGTMTWANGDRYEGSFNQDFKEGFGKLTWANGDFYEGEFLQNLQNGKGKYTWKNGEFFEGDWKNGVMYGKGTMDYTSAINIKGTGHDVQSVRNLQFDIVGNGHNFDDQHHAL